VKMVRGELKHVDVTAPYRALLWPVLELILVTGICWIAIGWLDVQVNNQGLDVALRIAVVALWAGLSLWRFVLPVTRPRRKRFIITKIGRASCRERVSMVGTGYFVKNRIIMLE